LGSARDRLFEDVAVQVGAADPVVMTKAISGVVPSVARFDAMGQGLRVGTHSTRGLLTALPGLAKGHVLINQDGRFRVIDSEPVGDGRFEIAISLDKIG